MTLKVIGKNYYTCRAETFLKPWKTRHYSKESWSGSSLIHWDWGGKVQSGL